MFILRAIYTGFFFKAWDALFGTGLDDPCTCFKCRPARTLQMWKDTVRPDYSVLLSPKWWLSSSSAAGVSLESKAY